MFTVIEPTRPTENLRAIGAGAAAELGAVTELHHRLATERLLADVDSFADELAAACMGAGNVESEVDRALRRADRLFSAADAVVLGAAIRLAAANDIEDCGRAFALLVSRFVERSAARVDADAAEIAGEVA